MKIPLLLTLVIALTFGFSSTAAAQCSNKHAKACKGNLEMVCKSELKSDSEFLSCLSGLAHMDDKSYVVKSLAKDGWKRASFLPAKYDDWCYDYDTPETYRRITLLQNEPTDKDFQGIFLFDIDAENVNSLWRMLESMGYRFVRKKKTENAMSMNYGTYTHNVYYFNDDKGVCAMICDDEYNYPEVYTLSVYFQHLYK